MYFHHYRTICLLDSVLNIWAGIFFSICPTASPSYAGRQNYPSSSFSIKHFESKTCQVTCRKCCYIKTTKMLQSTFVWQTRILLLSITLISNFVFSAQASESDLHACFSAEKQRHPALSFFNLPCHPNTPNYSISASTYTNHPSNKGVMQMRAMFSEALPALLSCIFYSNAWHIGECKKSILIDSSWNNVIMFHIYKGNETRRFLWDS